MERDRPFARCCKEQRVAGGLCPEEAASTEKSLKQDLKAPKIVNEQVQSPAGLSCS